MEPRHLIRLAIAASVLGHLALVTGVLLPDARPMEPREDSVAVDLVTPQDLADAEKKADQAKTEPEKPPEPAKPEFRLPEITSTPSPQEQPAQAESKPQPEAARQQAAAAPPPQSQPQPQPAPAAASSPPPQQQAGLQPPASPSAPPQQEPPQPSAQVPPQPDPDLTVKYGVNLGLPGFGDGGTSEQADLAKTDIAAFHRHLKTCLKLPAGVSRGDDAMVKLRATLSPDGRLTADPTVIEVRRPAKAGALLQAAKAALEACQPYSMLPADKYQEWKVLDLPFTPQDFAS